MERRYLCIFLPKWKQSLMEILSSHNPQADNQQKPPESRINRDDCYVASNLDSEETAFHLRKKAPINKPNGGISESKQEQLAFIYLCKLIPWANKFAPLVAIDREAVDAYRTNSLSKLSDLHYGLILETTGTDRLHAGELSLLQKISAALERRKIEHRLAITPSVGASWACSRFFNKGSFTSKNFISISRNNLQEELSRLPPQALRLSAQNLELLKKLGIYRIGQLLEFQSKALASRFGMTIVERIEQALAQRIEPLVCARYKEFFKTEKIFDIPVCSHLTLQAVIIELFSSLLSELKNKKKIAGLFEVDLYPFTRHGTINPIKKQFSLYHASNSKNHIMSVVEPWISAIRSNDGIKKIEIEAKFTKNEQMQQSDLYSDQRNCSPLPELLNQLLVRLGKNHVAKIFFEESHIPEKSFGYSSVMERTPKYSIIPKTTERPSYIFTPPQPISALALLPDKPPASISWRGEKLSVTKSSGPERISPEWWLQIPGTTLDYGTRDYFKLQDQYGRWLWVFRSVPEMQWFIHGVWN